MILKVQEITKDKRGSIFLINGLLSEDKEFTFMEMKKGSARGGCFHSTDEFFVVVKGRVKFICGDKEDDIIAGSSGKIPASKPHAFIALEDSIVSEWGITTKEKKLDKRDESLRSKINEINKSGSFN